jgi:hypothetical protein
MASIIVIVAILVICGMIRRRNIRRRSVIVRAMRRR